MVKHEKQENKSERTDCGRTADTAARGTRIGSLASCETFQTLARRVAVCSLLRCCPPF